MSSFLPLIVLNGLLVLLNAGPLSWQFSQGNSGAISMGLWVMIGNLISLVNMTAWYDDAVNRAPIWCDISVKLRLGVEVGRLASVMCIARFLADIVSPRATAITRHDRRRRAIFDYSISLGVPALTMACHVIYQPNRFSIARNIGCRPTSLMTWPTLVLRTIWPPVFAVIAVLYSGYTIYRLIRHRRNFGRVVAGAHSALTTTRFIRLAALSFSYLAIGVPLTVYSTVINVRLSGRYLEYSWRYVHSKWALEAVATDFARATPDLSTWADIIVGILFFAAFGFGTEALAVYSRLTNLLRSREREGSHAGQGSISSNVTEVGVKSDRRHMGPDTWDQGTPPDRRHEAPFHVRYPQQRSADLARGVKVVVEREQEVV